MIELIDEIIKKFGGRVAGSDEERGAQYFIENRLSSFCDKTQIHHFRAALSSKFESLKLFSIFYFIALAISLYSTLTAAIISLVNALLFFLHFVLFRDWFDPLLKKSASLNVIGTLLPEEEVKSTVIISGHMDSAYEFKWWFYLKHLGGILTIVSSLLLILSAIFFSVITLLGIKSISSGISLYIWALFVLLSPSLIFLFDMRGKNAVDGASDNLSGIAIAYEVLKSFSSKERKGRSILKNTKLKFISFGSEEEGLKGSSKYVKEHSLELMSEKAVVINIDCISNVENLTIVSCEPMALTRMDRGLISRMKESFEYGNSSVKVSSLTIGGTDASSFRRYNIPAISIIGMSTTKLPINYHTRLDSVENVEYKALFATKDAIIHFIEKWDRDLLK